MKGHPMITLREYWSFCPPPLSFVTKVHITFEGLGQIFHYCNSEKIDRGLTDVMLYPHPPTACRIYRSGVNMVPKADLF